MCALQIAEVMTAAEQAMQGQLAGPTIALLDDMPPDLWTRLSNRLSTSTAAAAQVHILYHVFHDFKSKVAGIRNR